MHGIKRIKSNHKGSIKNNIIKREKIERTIGIEMMEESNLNRLILSYYSIHNTRNYKTAYYEPKFLSKNKVKI